MHKTIPLILLILSVVVQAQDHENVEQVGRIYNQWDYAEDAVGEVVFIYSTLVHSLFSLYRGRCLHCYCLVCHNIHRQISKRSFRYCF